MSNENNTTMSSEEELSPLHELCAVELSPTPTHRWSDGSLHLTPPPNIHTKGWTGQPLTSFDQYFPLLPPELRLRVWSFCIAEPRVIDIETDDDNTKFISRNPVPAYIQVCQESRYEGLKIYENLGVNGSDLQDVRVNFELDTVVFGHQLFTNQVPLATKGMQIRHVKVRNLGLHYTAFIARNQLAEEIEFCYGMKKLYVVCEDCPLEGAFGSAQNYQPTRSDTYIILDGKSCCEFDTLLWPNDIDAMILYASIRGQHAIEAYRDHAWFSDDTQRYLALSREGFLETNYFQERRAILETFQQGIDFVAEAKLEISKQTDKIGELEKQKPTEWWKSTRETKKHKRDIDEETMKLQKAKWNFEYGKSCLRRELYGVTERFSAIELERDLGMAFE